ncbi:UBR1 [Candida jiufengensis]|uniref:UBR1 n=1 Tax=Candida jiufengensis TaxID=497108 RepID=UPI002224DBBB|nr:UBR1 [Candida jiufengensis]KAI5955117.1 UBR1 [Candida jiufengensis]
MSDENKDKLKRFLVELPSQLEFTNSSSIQSYLYKILYFTSTSNGKYLNNLFPGFPSFTTNDENLINNLKNQDFNITTLDELSRFYYQEKRHSNYSHPQKKPCARLFKSGDAVYRCEDCGFDDTCVLCSFCFNPQDHIDHNVSMYTSQGLSGGVCDCGDPEAFINPLHCKCATTTKKEDENMDFVFESLYQTIKICLKYILDVTNSTVSTLPLIHSVLKRSDTTLDAKTLSNYFSLPFGHYGGARDDNSADKWYLILWNDEFHDLGQAVRSIKLGTGFNDPKATGVAQKIDKEGYCILKEGKSVNELLSSKFYVEQDGLIATIVSARDFQREIIVKNIFLWFEDILNSTNESFKNLSRDALTSLLIDRDFTFSKVFPAEFIASISMVSETKEIGCYNNGIPQDGKFVNLSGLPRTEPLSRFQILILYQIRFPKSVRKKLVSILIPILVSNVELKSEFAKQFTELYPSLLAIYTSSDREDHLNLISEITSQLYTCPLTMKVLLQDLGGKYILNGLTNVIRDHCSTCDVEGHYLFEDLGEDTQRERRVKRAVMRGIHDLEHFTSKNLDLSSYMNQDNLPSLLNFLNLFQGYLPFTRKSGDHVEHESMHFRYHSAFSIPILSAARNIANSSCTKSERSNAITSILSDLNSTLTKVSESSNAFVHALTTFLSYLLQHGVPSTVDKNKLLIATETSLRTIVLASQIKVGFWIRNGYSVSRQASMYFGSDMSEFTYSQDFYLQQLSTLLGNPNDLVHRFIKVWEFDDWFTHDKETVYEDRFYSMVERFVSFTYNLLTDRSAFTKLPTRDKALREAKKNMAYYLCENARRYSVIKSKFDPEVASLAEFDEILYEIADYQPPSTLLDTGLYRLKESVSLELDPISLFLDPSKFQVISDVLIKNTSKSKKIKEDEVILKPIIIPSNDDSVNRKIGEFAKTTIFFKLIYKLLRVAIDSSNESYLPQLLHLIHAIVLDDEINFGPNYLNQKFLDIPICDLLLSIVDSKMSKSIVRKADYLVEQLIKKDDQIIENLVSCFGEEFVQKFKKRKTEIFESNEERAKRKAEERKNKILKKYSKRQEKFLSKNKEFTEEVHDDHTENSRTCVLCGEKESSDKAFGILCATTVPGIFWQLDYHKVNKRDTDLWSQDLYAYQDENEYGEGYDHDNFSEECERTVYSTCGHGIHYDCFKGAGGNMKFYPCSLCHNYYQFFIPSFAKNLVDEDSDLLYKTTSLNGEKKRLLLDSFIPEKRNVKLDIYNNVSHEKEPYKDWINILANSIQMNEMTTRLNGLDGYSQFLKQIPKYSKVLMKSLVQAIILIPELKSKKFFKILEGNKEVVWNGPGGELIDIFNETIYSFFTTEGSLSTIVQENVENLLWTIVMSYIDMDVDAPMGLTISHPDFTNSWKDDPCFEVFHELWTRWFNSKEFEEDNNHIHCYYVYQIAQQVIGIYLRQVVIFQDVLLSLQVGDDVISNSIYSDMEQEIESQKNIVGIEPFFKVLKLTPLHDIISKMRAERPDSELKAYKVNFPGQIKLTTLPKDYQQCLLSLTELNAVNKVKCLLCGDWFTTQASHSQKCATKILVLFDPKKNIFRTTLSLGTHPITIDIPAAYLTKHGEPKSIRYKGKATLNEFRFKEFTKLWLNQTLSSFVTRNLFGHAHTFLNGTPAFTVPTNDMMDEEDDDEEWMDEDEFMVF